MQNIDYLFMVVALFFYGVSAFTWFARIMTAWSLQIEVAGWAIVLCTLFSLLFVTVLTFFVAKGEEHWVVSFLVFLTSSLGLWATLKLKKHTS